MMKSTACALRKLLPLAVIVLGASATPALADGAGSTETGTSCISKLQSGDIQAVADIMSDATKAKDTKSVFCYFLDTKAKNADIFSFDYGVPRSPALMLAGLSPDKITPATSLKAFVVSLPSLVGSDSTATSAAFDFAPAWALADDGSLDVMGYTDDGNYWTRVLYRTRVSTAVSKGVDGGTDPTKTQPSRLAFGINVSLLSNSDPIMASGAGDGGKTHWMHCLLKSVDAVRPYLPPPETHYYDISNVKGQLAGAIALDNASGPPNAAVRGKIDEFVPKAKVLLGEIHALSDWTYPAAWDDQTTRDDALGKLYNGLKSLEQAVEHSAAWTEADAKAAAAVKVCTKESSDLAQKGADLQIGAGVVLQGPGGGSNWADFKDPNGAVWIAGKLPFDIDQSGQCERPADGGGRNEASCWVFGGSGRYSGGEKVATGVTATPFFKANVLEGWVGIERIDSSSKFGAYVGYVDQAAADAAGKPFAKSGTRWLISGAYSMAGINDAFEGLWLVGSYGAANGSTTTLDDKVALLTLTYAPPTLTTLFQSK